MVCGDRDVMSSNHHSLPTHGFIDSGVLVDDDRPKPTVSGDEEHDDDERFGVPTAGAAAGVSGLAVILENRAEMSFSRRPEASAAMAKGSQLLTAVSTSAQVQ
uniref:Uncharacterized protein n=1 Tax=Arundo donax TaxID=35708 RepID=A0A0A9D321_ARUDO